MTEASAQQKMINDGNSILSIQSSKDISQVENNC